MTIHVTLEHVSVDHVIMDMKGNAETQTTNTTVIVEKKKNQQTETGDHAKKLKIENRRVTSAFLLHINNPQSYCRSSSKIRFFESSDEID